MAGGGHDVRDELGGAVDDLLSDVTAVIDRMVRVDPRLLADAETIVDLHRQLERFGAVVARAAAAFDASDDWQADGAHSAAAWLSTRCRLPRATAKRRIQLGHQVADMPLVESGWLSGELNSAQVGLLAGARNDKTADAFARDEGELCGHATQLPFHHFVKVVKYWRYRADPNGAEADAEALTERRRFHLSQSFQDLWFADGVFDPIAGAILDETMRDIDRELFEADWSEAKARLGREPTTADLARTPAQRRADALVEMARRARAVPADARAPEPLFSVLIGYETFAGPLCQLANGTVVTPGSLVPYLDRAWVERVVFEGPGRVIDIGVRRRLFGGATRRAVELAGQECFDPYCDVPAQDCEIDHILPWAVGGTTTQDNGRPACGFHNRRRQPPRPPPHQRE